MIARTLALALLATVAANCALAQNFPVKQVRIIVGLTAGGTTDLVARILAQKLGEAWGQNVIVDNRPGASGMIGADLVAKAAPDGYTLLVTPQTSIAVAPALYGKAPYDAVKDFATITLVGSTPLLMIVHPSFPPKTFAEFAALAKRSGERLTFGSGGIGSSPHMAGELLSARLGVRMNHIPYKGENPAIADTIGGQIPIMFANLPVALPHVKSGKLRALALTGDRRSRTMPDVPTLKEMGIDISANAWWGILAPANTPKPIIDKLVIELRKAIALPEVESTLIETLGMEVIALGPEATQKWISDAIARWGKVVKDNGIRAE
jgi:tripartite-type tricarboxylate transporter receptor subunit TctC